MWFHSLKPCFHWRGKLCYFSTEAFWRKNSFMWRKKVEAVVGLLGPGPIGCVPYVERKEYWTHLLPARFAKGCTKVTQFHMENIVSIEFLQTKVWKCTTDAGNKVFPNIEAGLNARILSKAGQFSSLPCKSVIKTSNVKSSKSQYWISNFLFRQHWLGNRTVCWVQLVSALSLLFCYRCFSQTLSTHTLRGDKLPL